MQFGVMDHMDLSSNQPIQIHYENRLQMLELLDQAGFYCFHVTEHHCTPLGGGASPSVFLSAAAQRTKNLRLGTLVYALPAHHPIRLTEEIGMIDQMSGGRIDLGFGRGSVPAELALFGVKAEDARGIYDESLACIVQGLSTGRIDFRGRYFQIDDAPIFQRPKQQPHPPIWYGVHSLESAERAARQRFNIVCNEPIDASATYIARFREVWTADHPNEPLPHIGLSRSVVVASSDAAALTIARRAHAAFQKSFRFMYNRIGQTPGRSGREASFDELIEGGNGVAGTPQTVLNFLHRELEETEANYCVMRMAFGDMSLDEMLGSVRMFIDAVMPELSDARLRTVA